MGFPQRRRSQQRLLSTTLATAAAAAVAASANTAAPVKPNLLFLLVDDFGYNDVNYHNRGEGPGWTETPNMNRLADRGVKLENYCASQAPFCVAAPRLTGPAGLLGDGKLPFALLPAFT